MLERRDAVIIRRLLQRTEIDHESGCFEWIGYRDKDGYGNITVPGDGGQPRRINRVIANLFYGMRFDDHRHVLHSCDNPCCWNPDHLRVGTNAENMADAIARGRFVGAGKGSAHHGAKLTEGAVAQIRMLHAGGAKQRDIATEYGLSNQTVNSIVLRRTWRHV